MSVRSIALGAAALALCGACIQLGGIAASTNFSCRSENSDSATMLVPISTGTGSSMGRRLLVNSNEYKARCSFVYSMDWWSVFYQLAIVIAALVTARNDDALISSRTRVGILFSIAAAWVVLRANIFMVGTAQQTTTIITVQTMLKDASIAESDYKNMVSDVQYGIYTSQRAYVAGTIISAIAYFVYIIFVLADEEAVPSAKAAENEEA